MDKRTLVAQLEDKLREIARTAHGASVAAAEEAREGATSKERRADARVALEYASLAKGQGRRAERAFHELATLSAFRAESLPRGAAIAVGAVVEVDDEETGEGRTFFLAPVGAGMTLTGPGGDGFLTVVTPNSPIGRAVLGRRTGDVVERDRRGRRPRVVHHLGRLSGRYWQALQLCVQAPAEQHSSWNLPVLPQAMKLQTSPSVLRAQDWVHDRVLVAQLWLLHL